MVDFYLRNITDATNHALMILTLPDSRTDIKSLEGLAILIDELVAKKTA